MPDIVGVPNFLKKANEETKRRKFDAKKIDYNMIFAIKRYEDSLDRAENNMRKFEEGIKEKLAGWCEMLDEKAKIGRAHV